MRVLKKIIISGIMMSVFGITQSQNSEVRIALSKGSDANPELNESYQLYCQWLKATGANVLCVDLYPLSLQAALDTLKTCKLLLLTGGADIQPVYYLEKDEKGLCGKFDEARDEKEFALFGLARELKIPVVGICRGMQLINVALGGNLYFDLPSSFPKSKTQHRLKKGKTHKINIEKESILYTILQSTVGQVSSSHHQGLKKMAGGIKVIATAPDGVVEAIVYQGADDKPFIIAVQWHPERMDFSNPLSGKLAMWIIEQLQKQ